MNPAMASRLAWQDDRLLFDFMAEQLLRGRLLLCLGAGVSRFYGLPAWDALLRSISKKPIIVSQELPLIAETIFNDEFGGDSEKFHQAVHAALYASKATTEEVIENRTMRAIGALVSQSLRGKVASILTLNYDDLIEQYMSFHGYVVQTVRSEMFLTSTADVVVYHPHGFLPENARPDHFKEKMVITRADYEREIDGELWQDTILRLFATHLILFIGQSGADARISSILAKGKIQNPYTEQFGFPFYGIRLCSTGDELKSSWETRGIYCKEVSNLDADIPAFLFELCQFAAKSLGDPNE